MTMKENPPEHRFDDHSVIVPAHNLKSLARMTGEPGTVAMDVVAKAEAALAELEGEFDGWMDAECSRLNAARAILRNAGPSRETLEGLFSPAHDIKGEAATLGFPLAGRIASSLCRLVSHAPAPARVPMALIDHHVDSIRAVLREQIRQPHNPIGSAVAEKLAILVETFLAAELKDGYAAIAADAAPRIQVTATR
jgi:chemotaxis protein histidine kinase CheA